MNSNKKEMKMDKFHIFSFKTPVQFHNHYQNKTMPENNERRVNFALAQITTEQIALLPEVLVEDKPITINAGLNFGIDNKQHLLKVMFKNIFLQEETPFIII